MLAMNLRISSCSRLRQWGHLAPVLLELGRKGAWLVPMAASRSKHRECNGLYSWQPVADASGEQCPFMLPRCALPAREDASSLP